MFKKMLFGLLSAQDRHLRETLDAILAEQKLVAADIHNLEERARGRLLEILASPKILRVIFEVLRNHRPTFVGPGIAVVSKYDDVLEVLSHDEVFAVRQIYADRMERTSGAFILGMENTPQYQREASLLRMAGRPGDLPGIRRFIIECADGIINEAKSEGRLEMVNGLSRLVPTRLVAHYFGVPGPDEPTTMRWHRTIFHDIFLNPTNEEAIRAEAEISAREMNSYLDGLIAERKSELVAGNFARDDFLSRLLKMQDNPDTRLDDEGVRRNVAGTILGAIETTSKAITQAFDQLLEWPEQLQAAQSAALADDDKLVSAYAFEALRFNPHNPIIIRHCDKPYIVAKGTSRETLIPEGSTVFVGVLSAMFDPAKLDAPDEFRIGRPDDNYIHFGFWLHKCFGEYINRVQVPEVIKTLLRLNNVRRAAGSEGELQYDGPFPDSLTLDFDAG